MAKHGIFSGLFGELDRDAVVADTDIREGRFQRALSLIAGLSSILSGLEVAYEHYRGSYGQRIMWSPVILSPLLFIAGVMGTFSKRAARTVLPIVSWITLADSVVGFGFHARGVARKPGGWRLPVANIIMGPPIFAPLLFGIAGYLGVIASHLRRTDAPAEPKVHPLVRPVRALVEMRKSAVSEQDDDGEDQSEPSGDSKGIGKASWEQDIRDGRFQKHMAVATAAASLFSGVEALYSHYKNNFRYRVQWSPIIVSGLLTVTALGAVFSRRMAKIALPVVSFIAMANGGVGFVYHVLGLLKKPGGLKKPLYNLIYGPPIFAPLLFAACGALGLLASLMRREK
jgi:hypothetical protein